MNNIMGFDYNLIKDITDIELKNFNKMISESTSCLKEEIIEAYWITDQCILWVEGLKKILQRLTSCEVYIKKKLDTIYTPEGEFLRLDIRIYIDGEQIHHIGLQNRIYD